MQQALKREDYLTLHYIVQQGHKKYLKQSRLNSKQPCFNILRVLTAFKQIFPTTPDRLYKLIMLITKKHNPQTLDQWAKAIQKINTVQTSNSSSSFYQNQYQQRNINHSNLNESSIRQADSRVLKQKNHQESIKTYKQELDNQIEYIESKRSRMKFVGDFRVTEPSWMTDLTLQDENKENVMEHSNKNSLRNSQHINHLISFEPTHKDSIKQNAQKLRSRIKQPLSQTQKYQLPKKINPYHQITKIDNLSLIQDHQPTSKDESKTMYSHNYRTESNFRTESNSRMYLQSKTPRDHSIIRVMGLDSKDSDLSMRKSELVCGNDKSREILEYQDYNMTLQQWETLNDRAVVFCQFNIKLKAFSALLANYQAFQYDRFLKKKADIFHSCYLQTKVVIGLKNNVHIQQIFKEKLKKAEDFHKISLSRKTWSVLNIIKQLKIYNPKKTLEISSLNRVNYEFFLAFMFKEKNSYESSPQKSIFQPSSNESFDFMSKVEYFSKTQNFQNVWNIYKYFGLNINISKQQLSTFFDNYYKCVQRTIFSLLKKNVEEKKHRFLEMHDRRILEKAFSILLSRKDVGKQQRQNVYMAEYYANKKLKQKAYKILLSIVYSTKIFSKRQQFIEAQNLQKTKLRILKKWISEYKKIQLNKNILSERLELFIESVTKFARKVSFRSIKQESDFQYQKMLIVAKHWQANTMTKVFKRFRTLLQNKKKYVNLCESNQIEFQKKFLFKWLRIAKISHGLNKILINCNKLIFKKLFVPLSKSVVKDYLMSQEQDKNLVKECFDALKINHIQSEKIRQQNMENTTKTLKNIYAGEFMHYLRLNNAQAVKVRHTEQIQQKSSLLQAYLCQTSREKVFIEFKKVHTTNSVHKQKVNKIKILVNKGSACLLMKNTLQNINLTKNKEKLMNYIKIKQLQDICFQLKRNQTENLEVQLTLKTQKKIFSNFMRSFQLKHQNMLKLKQYSEEHFIKTIERKALFSLAQNFIEMNEKIHSLQEMLSKSRKKEYFAEFVKKVKKQVEIKLKSEIVQKIQPFSCLRENTSLKSRQKLIKESLKTSKISQAFNSLHLNSEITNSKKNLSHLSENLHHQIFWFRFNTHFIESLLSKKHTFMAYKFRALKLYALAFNSWKDVTQSGRKNHRKVSKEKSQEGKKRQQSFNIRNKESLHMYKPTDCE